MYKNLVHTNVYEYNVQTTHTFDNCLHRTGVPRLRRGSYHGEPTPLTLASRGGSVGPLFRPGECSTAPDPSGEYDETRGSRPQDVGVSSLRPHSQRSAETHDDDRRRAAISRARQSSKCNYLEPTRLKTVRSGRPKPSNNEVRRREKTIPAEPTGRPLSGGRENEGGSTPPPENATPRPTTQSETFGRITTNCNMPHPQSDGGAPCLYALQCYAERFSVAR